MRGILEFNLPEEKEEFKLAQNARRLDLFINEFDNNSLRRRVKYDNLNEEQQKLVEDIRTEFWSLYNELVKES